MKALAANSTTSYIDLVLQITANWCGKTYTAPCEEKENSVEIWFRGQSRSSHTLIPSAYRGTRDHESMFNRFVAAGSGVLTPQPANNWDWYFAAQHYELPTRLLDWTESALTALFFALRGMKADDELVRFDKNDVPAVWVMDAGALNHISYGHHEIVTPSPSGAFSCHWEPGKVSSKQTTFVFEGGKYSNKYPIAIWPTRATSRIMAQDGCFTIHGSSHSPIEALFATKKGKLASRFVKIEIHNPERVEAELFDLGLSKLRLFPELHNLAGLLRRQYA